MEGAVSEADGGSARPQATESTKYNCCAPSYDSANYNHCNSCHGAPSRRALQYDVRALHKAKGSLPEGEETFGFFKEFFEFFELSRSDAEKFALRICSMEFALQIPLKVSPARRRQRAQYIIVVRISRHHPSASLPPSSERRANRCPKFAQNQRLPPRG